MRLATWLSLCALGACGTTTANGGSVDALTSGDGKTADTASTDSATGTDASGTADTAVDAALPDVADVGSSDIQAKDTVAPADVSAANQVHITVNDTVCWTLATGAAVPSSTCATGDIVLMVGANVDLSSSGQTPVFCPITGTFSSAASIPADYSSCAWTDYIEGIGGLADTGYIVRNTAMTHHWKLRIAGNTLPNFDAELLPID